MDENYKIIIENKAKDDLLKIYDYITNDLGNKEKAVNLLNKINDCFDAISIFPRSMPLVNDEYIKNKNLRKYLIEKYIVFYEVDDEEKEIIIIRILYGMTNYAEIL